MGRRDVLFVGVLVFGAGVLARGFARPGTGASARPVPAVSAARTTGLKASVARVDEAFRREWRALGVAPAPPAPELAVLRRLSLALTGSIPSLEEIRRFEALPPESRLETWLERSLADRRAADYLAERLARAYVGTEDGPFLLFRRRRFTTWLSDALHENRPYDAIVRDLIADRGVWTDHPATNFLTVTFDQETGRPDPERLAARFTRCFLGLRLDCAQCHDHPFQPWKQEDFRGLAAFFGGVHSDLRGIRDGEPDYHPPDPKTQEPTKVEPGVPFRAEALPPSGTPRQRLASWVVDPGNPHFARATVNRFWALMFGKPLSEPVDDLPPDDELPPPLTVLAEDFSTHGYDLRRLIRVIAATQAFRADSALADDAGPTALQEDSWAVFPMVRLRPEQVAGSVYQSASLRAIGPQSSWVVRFFAYTARNDFVRRYGDTGEDEFESRSGTIPQRLLLMNGDLVFDKTKDELSNAATRIAEQAPTDLKAVEAAYLAVLTRRPTDAESAHFTALLRGTQGGARKERLADLYWTLLNATEFSWNH
jgi:hypothetical protein